MATHDYVIDNSTGSNVRSDINNVLQAILTNNSSSSAPSTTAAYMWWADTTTGILKIRNSSNNAWVELLQLDGTLTLEDGSAGTPALAFRDDLNTGIFSSAANHINFATNGVERIDIGTDDIVVNNGGADLDFRIEGDTEANLFKVDAGNDRVGIGTSSPLNKFHIQGGGLTISDATNVPSIRLVAADNTHGSNTNRAFFGIALAGNNFMNGTAANDTCVVYSEGGDLQIGTGTAVKAILDSSGRLLLGTTVEGSSTADDFTIATTSSTGITIRSGTSNDGNLFFSDGTSGGDEYRGYIQYGHASNMMLIGTNATERIRIDSDGRVHIGNSGLSATSSSDDLTVGNLSGDHGITIHSATDSAGFICFGDTDSTGVGSRDGVIRYQQSDSSMRFATAGNNERMRIDSAGRVGIGETSMSSYDAGAKTLVLNEGGTLAGMSIRASSQGAIYFADGLSGTEAYRGRIEYTHSDDLLRFGAGGNGNQVNINNAGALMIGSTSQNDDELLTILESGTNNEIANFRVNDGGHTKDMINMIHVANSGDRLMIRFRRNGSLTSVGDITTSPSSTTYGTSSDYRLKENEVLISDGITRLKTLKPYRFNFKNEPGKTVDGFFAHEVTAVPEAISGLKDAVETTYYKNNDTIPDGKAVGDVKEENAIVPQSLDYAKLTPLLTAALQEAISKIEVLETKVAALEAA